MGCTQGQAYPSALQVFAFLGFLASAMWINAAATELVNILRTLGIIFQLSNTVLGLTLLAWGNSIGGKGSAVLQCRPMCTRPPGISQGLPFSLCRHLLGPHHGTAGLSPHGLLCLLWGHHLQYPLGAGGRWWYSGQGLPWFPCLQPRESPCSWGTPGKELGKIHPRVPGMLATSLVPT